MKTLAELQIPAPDRTVVTQRKFNFSQEAVFQAWANPELLKQWWGPNGFTNTFYEFEFRPEGKWRFTMHGPNGANYENESMFLATESPNLIALWHISPPVFHVLATFETRDNQTVLTFNQIFETAEVCDKLRSLIVPSNEENMDRMETVLAKQS
jgi:uncharacterized protein YndB with AHSA1/START domain